MYSKVSITNFRGFENLTVDGLTRVNLILGDNGVGKTSLLEALFLLAGRGNAEIALRLNSWRGLPAALGEPGVVFGSLFAGFDLSRTPTIEAVHTGSGASRPERLRLSVAKPAETMIPLANGGGESGLTSAGTDVTAFTWEQDADGPYTRSYRFVAKVGPTETQFGLRPDGQAPPEGPGAIFLRYGARPNAEEDRKRFSAVRRLGQKGRMVELLAGVYEGLSDLELLEYNNETLLHASTGTQAMMPVHLLGDGLQRVASIYLAGSDARQGSVLVDEIDAGLHYTALRDACWQCVQDVAREYDVQVFATTHSWECVTAAYEAFEGEHAGDLSVHRLERVKGQLVCKSFGHEALGTALELGFEVR